jgi:hypothetical protein
MAPTEAFHVASEQTIQSGSELEWPTSPSERNKASLKRKYNHLDSNEPETDEAPKTKVSYV